MEQEVFRGITYKKKPKTDYSYLFKRSEDYGKWNCKEGGKKDGRKFRND